MIKINRIKDIQEFYEKLELKSHYHKQLKILGKNDYEYGELGINYTVRNNKILMYYEDGQNSKSGQISRDKTFLVCWQCKAFNRNWLISFLIVSPILMSLYLLSDAVALITGNFTMEYVLFDTAFFIIVAFVMQYSQAINLLNFLDEIIR